MPERKTVKLSEPAKETLEEYRDDNEHMSFDSAVRKLLTDAGYNV